MHNKLSTTERLQYSTIRIIGNDVNGATISGTGFFMNFTEIPNGFDNFPVIVTNKHVVRKMETGNLVFSLKDKNNNPIDTKHHNLKLDNFKGRWIYHPSPDVDLCALPLLNNLIDTKVPEGLLLNYTCLDKSFLPTEEQLKSFDAIEDIIMIGYPNGIWDEVNNQPIVRRGVTATHPNKDYLGKKEFMADIAAFPGSSGSPVFIMNSGTYTNSRDNSITFGNRLILLGVLYAGPMITSEGKIEVKSIPSSNEIVSIHRMPMNLGVVIKAEKILDIERVYAEHVRELIEKHN